jgi:hypothetical protein
MTNMTDQAKQLAIHYQTLAAVMADRARFWSTPAYCRSDENRALSREFQFEAAHFSYLARLWMGVEPLS